MKLQPTLLALALVLALPLGGGLAPALADNSEASAASTLQVGKLNKGGPSHSNLSAGQNRVTFQIGNDGVKWSNVTLTVSNGKRVLGTANLPTLAGVQNWAWTVPNGTTATSLYVTWKGTITAASPSAAEKGISNKGVKGCETC